MPTRSARSSAPLSWTLQADFYDNVNTRQLVYHFGRPWKIWDIIWDGILLALIRSSMQKLCAQRRLHRRLWKNNVPNVVFFSVFLCVKSWKTYLHYRNSGNLRIGTRFNKRVCGLCTHRLWHENLAQSDDHDQPVRRRWRQNVLMIRPPWKSRPTLILIRKGS